jgi:putative NADPH-quinone reductase
MPEKIMLIQGHPDHSKERLCHALAQAYCEGAEKGGPKALLKGKSCRIVLTMGMPAFAYRWIFLSHSLRSLERNILKFSGIRPVRETIIGMVDAANDKTRDQWFADMRKLGAQAK